MCVRAIVILGERERDRERWLAKGERLLLLSWTHGVLVIEGYY